MLPLPTLLAYLAVLLSFGNQEAANPVEAGFLHAIQVRLLHKGGDLIPGPADLPPCPEPIIESLDETAFGEEDPNELGGAEDICLAPLDFAVSLVSDLLSPPMRRCLSRPFSVAPPTLRC